MTTMTTAKHVPHGIWRLIVASTPPTALDKVTEAIEKVISGVVPGAACDGDWLITKDGIRVNLTGMARESARIGSLDAR